MDREVVLLVGDDRRPEGTSSGLFPELARHRWSALGASLRARIGLHERVLCADCGALHDRTLLSYSSAFVEFVPFPIQRAWRRVGAVFASIVGFFVGLVKLQSLCLGAVLAVAAVPLYGVLDTLLLLLVLNLGWWGVRGHLRSRSACPSCHSRQAVPLKGVPVDARPNPRLVCAKCRSRGLIVSSIVDSWETE